MKDYEARYVVASTAHGVYKSCVSENPDLKVLSACDFESQLDGLEDGEQIMTAFIIEDPEQKEVFDRIEAEYGISGSWS